MGIFKLQQTTNVKENKVMLTFSAFFAASAPDRLSKVTNPTGWKVKKKKKKKDSLNPFFYYTTLLVIK